MSTPTVDRNNFASVQGIPKTTTTNAHPPHPQFQCWTSVTHRFWIWSFRGNNFASRQAFLSTLNFGAGGARRTPHK